MTTQHELHEDSPVLVDVVSASSIVYANATEEAALGFERGALAGHFLPPAHKEVVVPTRPPLGRLVRSSRRRSSRARRVRRLLHCSSRICI